MKRRLLSLALAFVMCLSLLPPSAFALEGSGIEINEATFPDPNFLSYVQSLPGAEDGVFTVAELQAITTIDVSQSSSADAEKIGDLTGMEHFTALRSLSCNHNNLTQLDICPFSELNELSCSYNQLSSLNVNDNTVLKKLDCSHNRLTTLYLPRRGDLENLCLSNNDLNNLELSGLSHLKDLNVRSNNLTDLDLTGNSELINLDCADNPLNRLDVSSNTNLLHLSCSNCLLSSLDVSHNPALCTLNCAENQLHTLDLRQNPALNELDCSDNKLRILDVDANAALESLSCSRNRLVGLELSHNNKLNFFSCTDNRRIAAYGQNLTDVPAGFGSDRISNTENGHISGLKVYYYDGSDTFSYTYNCGNGNFAHITLVQPKDVAITPENFPDHNFRTVLRALPGAEDGSFTPDEIAAIILMDCSGRDKPDFEKISNLDGIQHFTALIGLDCSENKLLALDLTENTALNELIVADSQLAVADGDSMAAFAPQFNLGRAFSIQGGLLTGGKVLFDQGSDTITYSYHCGNGKIADFKLTKTDGISINEINFPDERFRAEVQTLTGAEDGMLSPGEIASIRQINCSRSTDDSSEPIRDLTGIEYFSALESLHCQNNRLTSLDLSSNPALYELNCQNNQLTSLDLSGNPVMRELNCQNNQLTSLNLSGNRYLYKLVCSGNQLSALDLSKKPLLDYLHCSDNQIDELILSDCPVLKTLICSSNQLTTLNLSKNTALTLLNVDANQFRTLSLERLPQLESLYCSENTLTELDISSNPMLKLLECRSSQLSQLNLTNNPELTQLDCSANPLCELDLSHNIKLEGLKCSSTQLTSLDLTDHSALVTMISNDNARTINDGAVIREVLPDLELNRVHELSGGYIDNYTNIYFSDQSCIITYQYDCGNNHIANCSLVREPLVTVTFKVVHGAWEDGSTDDLMTTLGLDPDGTATLTPSEVPTRMRPLKGYGSGQWDVTPNTEEGGILRDTVYTYTFTELPTDSDVDGIPVNDITFPDPAFLIYVQGLPGAEDGGLSPEDLAAITEISFDGQYSELKLTNLTGISYFTELTVLNCPHNNLSSLDLSHNTKLTELNCSYNNLHNVNFSLNKKLTSLNVDKCQLKTLDLTHNTELLSLICQNNMLETLDLSHNIKITELLCGANALSTLDVSPLTELSALSIDDLNLTSIDLSNNQKLTQFSCNGNTMNSLDLSPNPALTLVSCYNGQIGSLNLRSNKQLLELFCHNSHLTELDLSQNTKLHTLLCSGNQLTTLDLSQHTALAYLDCSNNQLTSLDLNSANLQYCITKNNQRLLEDGTSLSQMNPGFDPDRASAITGGSFDGGTVSFTADELTYNYDCGSGQTAAFKLVKHTSVITKATVTFQVVNGTWADGTSEAKTVQVTLVDGEGTLPPPQVPTGMIPNEGYQNGAWDNTPVTISGGITGDTTYTYTFAEDQPTEDEIHAEKAAAVVDEINAIGEVTLESELAIKTARAHYENLPETAKPLVTNLDVLEAAEAKLEELKNFAAQIKIVRSAVALDNNLQMKFAVNLSDLAGRTDLKAVITKTNPDGTKSVTEEPFAQWQDEESGTQKYVVYSELSAKEMRNQIEVIICDAKGQPLSDTYTTSIQNYAEKILHNDYVRSLKTLIVDMLNYGAAAQIYFNYDVDHLVNAVLTPEEKELASENATVTDSHTGTADYVTTSLSLDENIALNLYFKGITADMHAEVSYVNYNGRKVSDPISGDSFQKSGSSGIMSVPVETLAVADGWTMVNCVIKDAQGNEVASASDSMAGYAARARQKSTDENLKNLMDMTMRFSASARYQFTPH